ncbi:uncharacterized protein LOC111249472 [Varroa destructor]|uniref:Uncharacterized protein n=1 Tax=Varroa destructor TaxID=109461 RepID=A0A7M7JZ83_VARDE|nr:uncharacterized protein LOC111249472 [Varroa destructor]XP_022659103.1 uncharacterized protein LOC111249472 [Varroa destructor]XP_022659104.1 uncharacterized protein LOC111249472 [Varroa destructor]XP_022659105.1 uncharacterized protein LOC111249472 [Varroa destructor]XP_022659107.1 uncharacterized protein LOC111249472 [Varroa destructor]XP_022659108.1 uncharacterized protein LOC111249472 [Varroa destructor]XP_022659109.1 uncharacterized protein LOC111249472 [Varroa destructor]
MILSSARFDATSNDYHDHNNSGGSSQPLNGVDGKRKSSRSASVTPVERPQSKRRSSGFLKNLVHESKDVFLAPFHPSRRKGTIASLSSDCKDKGTQTRSTDYTFSCPYSAALSATSCSSGTIFGGGNNSGPNSFNICPQHTSPAQAGQNLQDYQLLQRVRRSSRARSDPSTLCSLANLSSLSGNGGESRVGLSTNGTSHLYSGPSLSSTSTPASSNTPQQQQQIQKSASENGSRPDWVSNGPSPNAFQWDNFFRQRQCPASSNNPSAIAHWQQAHDEFGRTPQSRTLPARLEPLSLRSSDWPLTSLVLPAGTTGIVSPDAIQHSDFTLFNDAPLFPKRSASSASSGVVNPPSSACCCPYELLNRFSSTSSCPSIQQQPDEQRLFLIGNVVLSLYRSLLEPFAEGLLRYPWGRDSLWLMAFVVFASILVLLGYVITTVLPTMLLAVCLAICKSLIFHRNETITHLRVLGASVRGSMFTRECVQSLRSATLLLVNHTLQLLVPPVIVPTSVQTSANT